jgi:hypothetical protein
LLGLGGGQRAVEAVRRPLTASSVSVERPSLVVMEASAGGRIRTWWKRAARDAPPPQALPERPEPVVLVQWRTSEKYGGIWRPGVPTGDVSGRSYALHLYRSDEHVGKFYYDVCDDCGLAMVGKISVYGPGQGYGRALLEAARHAHPALTWHTSGQMPGSEGFWQRMSAESGHPYTHIRSLPQHPEGLRHPAPEVSPLNGVEIDPATSLT